MTLSGYNGKSAKPSYWRVMTSVWNWVSVGSGPSKDHSRIGMWRPGNRAPRPPLGTLGSPPKHETDIGRVGSRRVLFGELALLLDHNDRAL